MLRKAWSASARWNRAGDRKRSASTLIELLVVIALIGILITMLLPSLKRSMGLARATICQFNLREMNHALSMYRMDNKGWLPAIPDLDRSATAWSQEAPVNQKPWFSGLVPTYLQDPGIFTCPEDPYGYRLAESRKPMSDPAVADLPSYGINMFIMTAGGGYLANTDRFKPSRQADTILLADLGPDQLRFSANPNAVTGPTRNASLMMWSDGFEPWSGLAASPWLTTRHDHGVNVVTLTGGVRHVRTTEILRSPIQRNYGNCAAGGCTLCNELGLFHYSLANAHLYWWTGPIPNE